MKDIEKKIVGELLLLVTMRLANDAGHVEITSGCAEIWQKRAKAAMIAVALHLTDDYVDEVTLQ